MSKRKLIVGLSEIAPLVMQSREGYSGFEVELWRKIAKKLDVDYTFEEHALADILRAIKEGKIDLAIGGITRTEQREKEFDFSHFTLRSGLRILISKKNRTSMLRSISSQFKEHVSSLIEYSAILSFFIILFSHIIWLIEQGSPSYSDAYWPGILQSVWWVVATFSTVGYGDFVPQTSAGHVFGILVIFVGMLLYGLLFAKLSSIFTLAQLQYRITSYKDLFNKRVVTKNHTIASHTLDSLQIPHVCVDSIAEAYVLLDNNQCDAVVYDALTLEHFVREQNNNKFVVVGDDFFVHTYGIAMQSESPLRNDINAALLDLIESGEYDDLYNEWFGHSSPVTQSPESQ